MAQTVDLQIQMPYSPGLWGHGFKSHEFKPEYFHNFFAPVEVVETTQRIFYPWSKMFLYKINNLFIYLYGFFIYPHYLQPLF